MTGAVVIGSRGRSPLARETERCPGRLRGVALEGLAACEQAPPGVLGPHLAALHWLGLIFLRDPSASESERPAGRHGRWTSGPSAALACWARGPRPVASRFYVKSPACRKTTASTCAMSRTPTRRVPSPCPCPPHPESKGPDASGGRDYVGRETDTTVLLLALPDCIENGLFGVGKEATPPVVDPGPVVDTWETPTLVGTHTQSDACPVFDPNIACVAGPRETR